MALIRLGGGVADIRGSIGGWTFSRNRGGAYIRNRVVPVNPGSPYQQAIRFAVAELTTRWVEVLTDPQRIAWELYAESVPLPNSLGDPRNVGGIAMYVRSNVPRLTSFDPALTVVDDAPTIFDLGTFTPPVCTGVDATAATATFTFTDTDEWANEVGGAMQFFGSRPKNPSIRSFKGPYRAMGTVLGAAMPPTSPVVLDLQFPYEADHLFHYRVNVTRADGRLASSARGFHVAV